MVRLVPKQELCCEQSWQVHLCLTKSLKALIQSWPDAQPHQLWGLSQQSLLLAEQGSKYVLTKSWHILTYPPAICKIKHNISYLLCMSQGLMLTRVTVFPRHLSSPTSHSVMVWRAAEPLTSAHTWAPPSSHSPSSSQTQVLDGTKQKHRGKTFRIAPKSPKKPKLQITCF